jgi:hypothetical protein
LQSNSSVTNYDLLITTTAAGLPTWTGGSYNTSNVLLKLTGQTTFATSGIVNAVINLTSTQQIPLTSGTKYALILIPGTPANGQMAWRGNSGAGSYTGGSAYQLNGTTWGVPTIGPKDHGFKLEGPCGGDTQSNGQWCCPGINLVRNGDFSSGNSFFTSQYAYNPIIGASTVTPGQYSIINGNQALAVSSTWLASDHATCNAGTGNFMAVNGVTGATGNRTVWRQTVAVTPGKQ